METVSVEALDFILQEKQVWLRMFTLLSFLFKQIMVIGGPKLMEGMI
jgi:hypothetical protein